MSLVALFLASLLFSSLALSQPAGFKPVPLAGAVYPAPAHLSQSETFAKANETFNNEIVRAFKSESIYGPLHYNASFSIEIYSLNEDAPLLTHHFTGPKLPSESGVKIVNSDTIYRLGSISKLLTTYVYLINAGFQGWNDPITQYVPELQQYAEKSKTSPIDVVEWDAVTVGSLASHLSGMTRDGSQPPSTDAKLAVAGLPKVPGVPGNYCGDPVVQEFPCDDESYLENVLFRHPVLQTFAASPIYSNAAWRLFTMALENITERPFSTLFEETFVNALDLTATSDTVPSSDEQAVVPVNSSISWFDADLRAFEPAGGHYSTINDLTKVGKAILNSTLIPGSYTRRWMKPAAFTSDPKSMVGAPWEIFRAPMNRTSWMYTKSGDLGLYSNNMILLPEFGIGITVLTAGFQASATSRILSDIITSSFVPAFDQAAKEEAVPAFAGVYTDVKTNSTMTLDVLTDEPGLVITSWTFGGTDVFAIMQKAMSTTATIVGHMYPSGLNSPDGKQVGWRAIFESQTAKPAGVFSSSGTTWFSAEGVVYGGQSIGEFIFDVGDEGADGLEFRLFDLPMEKTTGSLRKKGISGRSS
ncbi:uncharacterized protein HMPREF1541_09392 [Cyphellophora europaea CBS 101466]|uniref:Uncharacterized protein n=1 Tax=Cyphellophora europaea (strain CBS 101466) TaxID=1220924 RepID=W2SAA0_CYPE1|nr:uncharacterized protein HMPREF1541_09392 [Cyphellophora europaea CBS 101466]ETN45560.1 hypothetical protein HMPREF1541_09392 [Cyphellophora europaea CBS 101466]